MDFDLDLDYNNVQSDVLKNKSTSDHHIYQDVVKYASGVGVDRRTVDEIISSVEGEGDGEKKDKLQNVLDTIKKVAEGTQSYGATQEGENIGEVIKGGKTNGNQPKMDVKILGLDPLVFSLVALGLVIGIGIGISRLGKNTVK